MEAKMYLCSVRRAAERVQTLRAKMKVALEKAEGGVAGGSGVKSSNISNIPEAYAIQMDRYSRDIEKAERLIAEASRLIGLVQDPISQDILDLYYIEAEPWWKVARSIGKSYSYVCGETGGALHGKALNDFQEILKNHLKT